MHVIDVDHAQQIVRTSARFSNDVVLEIQPLFGGTTNTMYKCRLHRKPTIIIRLFGKGTEDFIDRNRENVLFDLLAEHGLGARPLGLFEGGRLEQFLDAQVLTAQQMRSTAISCMIARRLSEMHAIHSAQERLGTPRMQVFDQLRLWASLTLQRCGPKVQQWHIEQLANEVELLEQDLMEAAFSPICICHNDVNHLNILLKSIPTGQPAQIVFVDLEYAGWNPRAFDIANHWCEWASDFNTASPHQLHFDRMPNETEQRVWLKAYLAGTGGSGVADVKQQDVEALVREVAGYVQVSHLYWGLWGLLQSATSTLSFDYVSYASQRLTQYFQLTEARRRSR